MQNRSFAAAVKAAFPHTIPIMTGYLAVGMAYGVLMASKGYGFLWAGFVSAFAFCGSMQYVAITLLTTAFDPLQAFVLSLMVNARHLFYGISMVDAYKDAGTKKPYLIFALSDETYSLVSNPVLPEGVNRIPYCFLVSLFDQCYWILGSVLGSLLGNLPVDFTGIDFALTALFLTIFVEQWLSTKNHFPALVGVGAAVLCLVIFGANQFLIPTMILIAAILVIARKDGTEATA